MANITGTFGNDTLTGGDGDDTLIGLEGDDFLFGGLGEDRLFGGDGNDILEGGFNSDILDGGDGNDTAQYLSSANSVVINLATGLVYRGDARDDTLISIENITGSQFGDTITGDAGANIVDGAGGNDILAGFKGDDFVYGGAGDDLLTGGTGADYLDGGDGTDYARYSSSSVGVMVDLGSGTASGGDAQGDTLVNIERLLGSAHDDVLTGDDGNNWIGGLGGDDILSGGAGIDKLFGGAGADTFVFNPGDEFTYVTDFNKGSAWNIGPDTIDISNFDFDSKPHAMMHFEQVGNHVRFFKDGDTMLLLNTTIEYLALSVEVSAPPAMTTVGTDGNDSFIGGGTFYGERGVDTYTYSDGILTYQGSGTASYYRFATVERLANGTIEITDNYRAGFFTIPITSSEVIATLHDVEEVITQYLSNGRVQETVYNFVDDYAVSMHVNNDVYTGDDGFDYVDGGVGDDTLYGLGGNDILFGNIGNDHLLGGDGDDVLEGGLTPDILDGGAGIDTARYLDSANGVTVNLETGFARGGDANYDTFISIENLTGSEFNDTLTGDNFANVISGRHGQDILSSGSGDDSLYGDTGNDVLEGGQGADYIDGGDGTDTARYSGSTEGVNVELGAGAATGGDAQGDTLINIERLLGSSFDDVLTGDASNNWLFGAGGDDILDGGAGIDKLFGGTGADIFVMNAGDGFTYVSDFENDVDSIDLSDFGYSTIAEALENFEQLGNDVRFVDSDSTVLILNTDLADIADDILIA